MGDVVRGCMDKKAAFAYIASWAKTNIMEADRELFREMAETELLSLHEGNFARYQVRPSEFVAWQEAWTGDTSKARPKSDQA